MTDQTAEALEPSEEAPVVEAETQELESVEEAPTEDAVDDTPDPKPQGRFDKRIGQLTGEKHALKEDRDYWRDKALARPEEPKVVEPAPEPLKLPELADFDHDTEKWAKALGEFTEKSIDQAKSAAVTEITQSTQDVTAKQTQESVATQRQERFSEKATEFSEDVDDYFEIISNPTLNISPTMTEVLMELDNGPAVAYHLGKNPEIAHRIAQKSSVAAAIELGKIESSLGKKSPSPTSSNAPEPPNPISGSRGKHTKDPADMTDKEFKDYRLKQIAAR